MNGTQPSYQWLIAVFISICLVYGYFTPIKQPEIAVHNYSTDNFQQTKNTQRPFILKDSTLEFGIQQTHIQRNVHLNNLNESLGSGACAFDYDNDGWIDLLLLNGSGTTHFFGKTQWWQSNTNSLTLYRNINGKRFEDVTDKSGLSSSAWTMGCNNADFNNDGYVDVFLTNFEQNELWINNGGNSFTEVSQKTGIKGSFWSTTSSIVDVNQDGLLDIYINNYIDFKTNSLTFEGSSGYKSKLAESFNPVLYTGQANQLYINQGDLQFIEQAKAFGVENPQGRSLSSQWIDLNADSYPDLIVSNDQDTQNKVFLNQNGKKFEDISLKSQFALIDKNTHITIADFNNDQQSELFVSTNNKQYPKLFSLSQIDKEKIHFKDISEAKKLHESTQLSQTHWGSISADFNLDGWMDIYIANGNSTPNEDAPLISKGQFDTLLVNQEGDDFNSQNHLIAPNTYSSLSSRCALSSDFNNDGAPDLFITQNNGLGQLLINTVKQHNWIGIDLQNPSQSGATVLIETASGKQQQTFGQQQGFLCSSDKRLIFGLGQDEIVQKITITWVNGKTTIFENIEKNHYYHISKDQQLTSINSTAKSNANNQSSEILLNQAAHKLQVIDWLIQHEQFHLAQKELQLLSTNEDFNIRLEAFQLSQLLPPEHRSAFTVSAIQDQEESIRTAAINTIKQNEDERLIRWLIKRLDDQSIQVACAAANSFSHFFDEEEAMPIRKYSTLPELTKLVEQSSKEKQICLINALSKSERFRALNPLLNLLAHSDENTRLAATKGLGLLREKQAITALKNQFLSPQETYTVRAASLASIKQIDKQYDLNKLVNKALSEIKTQDEIHAVLETLYALNSDSDYTIIIPPESLKQIAISLKKWWKPSYGSKLVNKLRYMQLVSDSQKINLNDYQPLLSAKNTAIKLEAFNHLLTKSTEPLTSKILVRGLLNMDIRDELINNNSQYALDIQLFNRYAKSLEHNIKNKVLLKQANQLNEKQRFKLVKQSLLLKDLDEETLVAISQQFKLLTKKSYRQQCSELFNQNKELKEAAIKHLNACLLDRKFQNEIPPILLWGLERNSDFIYKKSIKIISNRNEPWARNFVIKTLEQKDTDIKTTKLLLESLPHPLQSSIKKSVIKLFNKHQKKLQAPYYASILIKQGYSELLSTIEKELITSIKSKNEDRAIQLAHSLIETNPDKVLALFIRNTN